MANPEHVEILKQGAEAWNKWRAEHPGVRPDLRAADLWRAQLDGADLSGADLWEAKLYEARLRGANLRRADLRGAQMARAQLQHADLTTALLSKAFVGGGNFDNANCTRALMGYADMNSASFKGATMVECSMTEDDLTSASLTNADLTKAKLVDVGFQRADLSGANLTEASLANADMRDASLAGANLTGAWLIGTRLLRTNIEKAIITGCRVYGVSAWGLRGQPGDQSSLIITDWNEPSITVDDIEVAQFIYLLLNHRKIRNVISTIGEKAVLILGRFTPERKAVLDAIAEQLRKLKYLPILFDFERIPGKDYTETIKVLAGLSRFVIADITQPKSVPQESQAIIPDFKIPFVRIVQRGEGVWSMAEDLNSYEWVIGEVIEYPNQDKLVENLAAVVDLVERKRKQLLERQAERTLKTLSIEQLSGGDDGA